MSIIEEIGMALDRAERERSPLSPLSETYPIGTSPSSIPSLTTPPQDE